MIKKTVSMFVAGAVMSLTATSVFAQSEGEITVGYFLEWPMPFQYAKVNGTYDEVIGKKINWVSFDSGVAMSAAMASGDVQISVSQGVPPFVVATSGGQDIQILDVAVSYSENDNCVVASGLEIDKTSASELTGKKVAVPLGTAAHYGFLKQMEHFGVDVGSMSVVDMAPAEGAAALSQGAVDMACGWGILVFDVTSAPASYVAENGEDLAKFLKVTADANAMWNAGGDGAAEMLPVIAKDAGMDEAATAETLAGFTFPSVEEQLSDKWFGGGSQTFMGGVAQVFVESGSIDSALETYAGTVNTGPLMAVKDM